MLGDHNIIFFPGTKPETGCGWWWGRCRKDGVGLRSLILQVGIRVVRGFCEKGGIYGRCQIWHIFRVFLWWTKYTCKKCGKIARNQTQIDQRSYSSRFMEAFMALRPACHISNLFCVKNTLEIKHWLLFP